MTEYRDQGIFSTVEPTPNSVLTVKENPEIGGYDILVDGIKKWHSGDKERAIEFVKKTRESLEELPSSRVVYTDYPPITRPSSGRSFPEPSGNGGPTSQEYRSPGMHWPILITAVAIAFVATLVCIKLS